MPVLVAGMVPPGSSGVADYGRLLTQQLRTQGFAPRDGWVVEERSLRGSLAASTRFVRLARATPPGSAVLWHYSSFSYGFRGVPLHSILFGLVLKLRRCRVVTVLHEASYPPGRRGWRGRIHWATQWCALRPVLLGSDALVVTTDLRAEEVRRVRRPFRRPVRVAPVFSTMGVPDPSAGRPAESGLPVVGIVKYTGDGNRPDVVLPGIAGLPAPAPRVVFLGAPGGASPEVRPWLAVAHRIGLEVEFTGVVETDELSRRLQACDVVVVPNDQGPSGRFTTLAAALAHGVPTVALDGPERWEPLVDAGALVVVPTRVDAVTAALRELLGSPARRAELGERGRRFYGDHMSIDGTTATVARLLRGESDA